MKSFGCLAFAMNPTHTTDKLAPRGIPCVFVGYPLTQKGFRLLDIQTLQMFVSRDVTFHETIFPFNLNTPKPYLLPMPTVMPQSVPGSYIYDDFLTSTLPTKNNNSPPPSSNSQNSLSTESGNSPITMTPRPRRSIRLHKPPTWMQSYITKPINPLSAEYVIVASQPVSVEFHSYLSTVTMHKDPVSFKQAMIDVN